MKRRGIPALVLALLVVSSFGTVGSTQNSLSRSPAVRSVLAAAHGHAPAILPNGMFVPQMSGAFADSVTEALATPSASRRVSLADPVDPEVKTVGCRNVFQGSPRNVRANQDCGYRQQSEEWVAVNPTDPLNIVVSQNDSKLSGNHTGVDFSVDGGRHWGDSVLPSGRITIPEAPGGVWSFDFFSDPVHAFDSEGNLYYVTLGADFAQDGFDGVFVWKSNSCLKGSALHSPGSGSCSPFVEPQGASAAVIRTNFSDPNLADDKELMAIDTSPTSPYQNSIYVTWTIFDFTGGGYVESPIYFSKSTDGGLTWTPAMNISGSSSTLCDFGDIFDPTKDPHSCNFDQGSSPVVGADGTIYVSFNNQNNSEETAGNGVGLAQQLMVKSTDGGQTWSEPTKIGDDYATQPLSLPGNEIAGGDCPLFRQCLSPNGYRIDDFAALAIDESTGDLAAFWSDFRNGGPCAIDPTFGLPVEPCDNHNNDVFVARSSDGGDTWGPTTLVSRDAYGDSDPAAQWQAWGAIGDDGTLYAGYYDRQFGPCESTGCNDITLASSRNSNHRPWVFKRITTDSMPNLTCSDNPSECGFLGDYMSIQAANGRVYLTWGDTRGRNGTIEEDVYFASVHG